MTSFPLTWFLTMFHSCSLQRPFLFSGSAYHSTPPPPPVFDLNVPALISPERVIPESHPTLREYEATSRCHVFPFTALLSLNLSVPFSFLLILDNIFELVCALPSSWLGDYARGRPQDLRRKKLSLNKPPTPSGLNAYNYYSL